MAFLGEQGPLCNVCFDEQISAATGWPRLPAPPPPTIVTGPDGRDHRLWFRLWRTPGGITAEAIEAGPAGEYQNGYELNVFGEHDADPALLLAELDERVRAETSRCYLEPDGRSGWQVADTEVAGRIGGEGEGEGPDVIVDGRRLGWEEFGRRVASFEGWWFRMAFGDEVDPQPAATQCRTEPDPRC